MKTIILINETNLCRQEYSEMTLVVPNWHRNLNIFLFLTVGVPCFDVVSTFHIKTVFIIIFIKLIKKLVFLK